MAINPSVKYTGKITAPSVDYPYGKAQNITVPGDGTGTPWEKDLLNDIFGFQQALLSDAGEVPTGIPEKVGASQYLKVLFKRSGLVRDDYTDLRATKSSELLDKTQCFITDNGTGGAFALDKTDTTTIDDSGITIVDADGGRWKRLFTTIVYVSWYGANIGAADNVPFIQAALDYADTHTSDLIVDLQGMELVLNSTMYIGDSIIQNGILAPLVDAGFTEGSGTRSNEGIVLTKSAAAVSYGLSSTAPKFKDIHVKVTRTANSGVNNINTVFLFENINGGYRQNCSHEVISTVGIVNPWDFYRNCKNFNIDGDDIDNEVTSAWEGGCWVRNFDGVNVTENITITDSVYTQNSLDEVIAIWIPSTATNAELRNISLTNVIINSSGAPLPLTISADATGSKTEKVTLTNVDVNSTTGDALSTIKVQRATSNGTIKDIKVIGGASNVAIDNSTASVYAVQNEEDTDDLVVIGHSVHIISSTGTSNSVSAFRQCKLIDCSNTWGFDIGAVSFLNFRAFTLPWSVNGGDYNGVAAGGRRVANCNLNDTAIIDVEKLINVDIDTSEYVVDLFTYAGSFATPDLVIIENIRLTENAITGAAVADDIFNFSTAGRYFINGFHYNGVRRALGSFGGLRTQRMDDVTLDNGVAIINTSKFGSGETPWGLFSTETHILPEGHRMEASAPATASVVTYIKKAGASIGQSAADWITVTSD